MKLFVLLILAVFASEKNEDAIENDRENRENPIMVKIEEDKYAKMNKKSKFVGVTYYARDSKWRAQRCSKNEKKNVYNGCYDDEETAGHASDTLARKLMENGEQNHKLNFPDDHTVVYPQKRFTSKYIGVIRSHYGKIESKWSAQRWSKHESKNVYNGWYDDEQTAAHASDTLARKLMENGERSHKLNFPDDDTEVHPEEKNITSKFIGVSYNKKESNWKVQRRSKNENTMVFNGYYDDEETAAHASDTLARKLIKNGEKKHKLNFPDDHIEVYREKNQNKKRKRPKDSIIKLENPQNN